MRQDNRGAGPPFSASKHWQMLAAQFENALRSEQLSNPEEQSFNLSFSGFAPTDLRLHRYVCWLYRRALKQRDSLGLLDRLRATCRKGRGFGYEMAGNYLSLDLLFSIDDFYNMYELDPAIACEPLIVAELGAGWGRLGHVLRSVNPRLVYVVFDLPEVLIMSQSYLPLLFPGDRFADYSEGRNVTAFSRDKLLEKNMWFLGPQQMRRFMPASANFVINIASFQEMPVNYVSDYLTLFSDIARGGFCYTRQLCDGKSQGHHFDDISGVGDYPFPSFWEKKYHRLSMLSDEFFEAGFRIPSGLPRSQTPFGNGCSRNSVSRASP